MANLSYATVSNVAAALGVKINEILDLAPSASITSDTRLLGAIYAANDEIDSYIRRRYAIPFTSPSDKLIRTAIELTRHNLIISYKREILTDADTRIHDETMRWLRDLSAGKADLETPPGNNFERLTVPAFVTIGSSVDDPAKPDWFGNW